MKSELSSYRPISFSPNGNLSGKPGSLRTSAYGSDLACAAYALPLEPSTGATLSNAAAPDATNALLLDVLHSRGGCLRRSEASLTPVKVDDSIGPARLATGRTPWSRLLEHARESTVVAVENLELIISAPNVILQRSPMSAKPPPCAVTSQMW